MNRMGRNVLDPSRTYACTRTAVQLCGSHVDWGADATVVGACPCKVSISSLNTNKKSNSLGFVECTAVTIESDCKIPVSGFAVMSVWLWHSASTSEISGREVWGGCNTLRHVGITSLMLSNRAVEVLTTSNASVECTSESSIHGDGGELVGPQLMHLSPRYGLTYYRMGLGVVGHCWLR